jgi:hypothetical protein
MREIGLSFVTILRLGFIRVGVRTRVMVRARVGDGICNLG